MSSKKTKENIFLNENRQFIGTFKCVGKLISPVRPALVALSAQPQPHAVQSKINTKKNKEAFHMLLQSCLNVFMMAAILSAVQFETCGCEPHGLLSGFTVFSWMSDILAVTRLRDGQGVKGEC